MAFFIYWRIRVINFANTTFHGITSTYVENTYFHPVLNLLLQDHLHLRGEHDAGKQVPLWILGSSPLTWRTLLEQTLNTQNDGIISTYVENTTNCVAIPVVGWDHLHLRGEHLDTLQENARAAGSSPPTWRTLK